LADRWPLLRELPSDVDKAIEQYNQALGVVEHLVIGSFEIQGHEHFDGDLDDRRRCDLCGEPVELAEAASPESWVHAPDANDWGDHTAELDLPADWPTGGIA
jgi:hypothetical protein